MATMIPPIYHANTSSKGEIEVFTRLRDDPKTKDWIVLHSLDVTSHQKQVSGEIDFAIIVPAKGVLCLEVKACHHLERRDGFWYYGNSTRGDACGPFKQASQAMHSIRNKLIAKDPSLRGILFWSAVIFPYVPFTVQSDEWHSWQVIDTNQFKKCSLALLLENVVKNAYKFISSKPSISWHRDIGKPTKTQCQQIVDILRPNFEFFESPKSRNQRENAELKAYTTEQFRAIDSMETNPRVIFSGPAGTGKTLLALEAARRSSETGKKVLFLCYNRLLGNWLEEQTASLFPNVTSKTLHSHMITVSRYNGPKTSSGFWEQELPSTAIDTLLEAEGDKDLFDELLVDEAQDILRENYIAFLDLSLRGGLAAGKWRFFGDFEKQAIYLSANLSLEQFQRDRALHIPIYNLRDNCRNTPRNAELVHLLGNLHPRYSRILRPDNNIAPILKYYYSNNEQKHLLVEVLQQLYKDGFYGSKIIILSPAGTTQIASTIQISPWKDRLKPVENLGRGSIGFCSIQAFKGLEAEVVIVTDIESIDGKKSTSLFYIAATRALHKLIILMHNNVKKDIAKLLNVPIPL